MNRLSVDKRKTVVSALVEGNSIRSTVRLTGVSKPTILKLIRDLGEACMEHHNQHVRGLRPKRVQTDEIWAFNYCKAKNVAAAKSAPEGAGDIWTWTAIDSDTKLMIAYHVGLRTQEDSNDFMLDLAGRILDRTQLTTDGNTTYLDAVENAFGPHVDYAQVIKVFGPDRGGEGAERKYSPGKVNGIKKRQEIGSPDMAHVSTSHIERSNLTLRMGSRRFTRLTNAHSKKAENHAYAVAMFFAYYNFCRVHSTLGTTPAIEAGLADHVWTVEELIGLLD